MTDKNLEIAELRKRLKEATQYPYVGQVLPNGYTVLANYLNRHVLAMHTNEEVPERFAIWHVNRDGDTVMGSYFTQLERAYAALKREIGAPPAPKAVF